MLFRSLPPDTGELGQSEGVRRDQFEHDNTCSPQTTPTPQNLGSKIEDAVVGAAEPGGDPAFKPVLVNQELGHSEHEGIPEQNISCQQKPNGGGTPQLSPVFGDDLPKMNLMRLDILPTNCSDPQALTTRGKGEGNTTEEPRGDSPVEQLHSPPTGDLELGHLENENTNFPLIKPYL